MTARRGPAGQVLAVVQDEAPVSADADVAGSSLVIEVATVAASEEKTVAAATREGKPSPRRRRPRLPIPGRRDPSGPPSRTEDRPKKTSKAMTKAAGAKSAGSPRSVKAAVYEARPVSLADVVAYTQEGGWVPGDQPEALEIAGRIYGYLVAVPVTAAAYALAWLVQHPLRLVIALVIGVVLWVAI